MDADHQPRPATPVSRRAFLRTAGMAAVAPAFGGVLATTRPWGTTSSRGAATLARAPGRDAVRWQACLRAARDLLLVGPGGQDLKLDYLRVLIDDGLPITRRPLRILIVGAGIAGLTAGLLLERAGHHVTLIEANGNRIGGRIKTFRLDPEQSPLPPFADPRQYAEAGAMRIPDFHPLTLALIDRLGLRRRLFFNVDVRPGTGNQDEPVPAVTYRSFNGTVWRRGPDTTAFHAPDAALHTWIRTNDQQVRRAEYVSAPLAINRGFHMPDAEARRTTAALLDSVMEPVRDYFSRRTSAGTRENLQPVDAWVEGWARLVYDFDHHSMLGFLQDHAGLGVETIEAIGTLENLTSRMPLSFIHSFQELAIINPQSTYWEIDGGTWRLPYALRPLLRSRIVMGRRVVRLECWNPGGEGEPGTHVGPEGPAVWMQTVREGGSVTSALDVETFTGDVALVTIPFSALRHVEVAPLFSYPKRRAVIELHYDSATKVLLEFSRRWWEFTEDDWRRELEAIRPGLYAEYGGEPVRPATAVVGGGSVSDNPNRFMYYPSHPVAGSPGGVVLASYTWADDASRWDSMEDHDRYAYALRGLQEVHGDRIEVFFTGRGQTQSWMRDPYAFGEAAVLAPAQLTWFQPAIRTPEGPVHFAGEHTSLKHAWIEGALESAVRAAMEINEVAAGTAR
jgi:monoamine oxidase